MNRLVAIGLAVCALGVGLSGCGRESPVSPSAPSSAEAAFARQFAELCAQQRWEEAYALTGAPLRARTTRDALRARFLKAFGTPAKGERASVTPRIGKLPSDPIVARERYEITNDPPQSTWRAWVEVDLTSERARAVCKALVIDEGQGLRIGYMRFERG